jgi:hypothetical protein
MRRHLVVLPALFSLCVAIQFCHQGVTAMLPQAVAASADDDDEEHKEAAKTAETDEGEGG